MKTLAGLVKKYYPKAESIGCFARITDVKPKTTKQLSKLRRLGYNSITIGVEAADDEALSFMHKALLTIYPASELYQEIQDGNWAEETEIKKLYELKTLIGNLNIDTYFATMGASNCVHVEGHLPKDKVKMMKWLDEVIDSVDEKELRRYHENLRHLHQVIVFSLSKEKRCFCKFGRMGSMHFPPSRTYLVLSWK